MWICPYPGGHIQATGVDAAGRKQYLYHPRWRERRDMEKFEDMLVFARTLPRLRERVDAELAESDELTYDRVCACAVRLLDRGFFRIGGEDYAVRNESYGLATMQKRHVSMRDGVLVFDYPAKSGKRRVQAVIDPVAAEIVARAQAPARRRRRAAGLQARPALGRPALGGHQRLPQAGHRQDVSAKDFRTWDATVLAAVALAVSEEAAATKTGRKRAITRAIKEVAHYLGNTPAVARASYIDPRVFDRYRDGQVIDQRLVARRERAQRRRDGDPGPPRAGRAEAAERLGQAAASSASSATTASSRVGLIVKI